MIRSALTRRALIAAAPMAALARPALVRAQSTYGTPLRVGEINSYSTQAAFTEPYRMGWQLAVAQANNLGGVNGRPLEFVSRDDGGSPDRAVQLAAELLDQDKVDLLAGGFSSEVALALSAFAAQRKTLYVAGQALTDALVWQNGNRYTYHVGPSSFILAAILVESAAALPAKSWVTVAPDDDYGRSAVRWFRQLLSGRRADVRFVGEQWPKPGQMDANAVSSALTDATPDGVFNALYGPDLVSLVRSGPGHGLFTNRAVVSMLTGDPEFLDDLGTDAPTGWYVTGYPWDVSDDPSNKQFVLDYQQRFHTSPTMASVIGAALASAIAAGILKSGSSDSEALADGFADASFVTPFGICRFRAIDHQSTMGCYVGQLGKQGSQPTMVNWRFVDGSAVLPPDDLVRKLRPA